VIDGVVWTVEISCFDIILSALLKYNAALVWQMLSVEHTMAHLSVTAGSSRATHVGFVRRRFSVSYVKCFSTLVGRAVTAMTIDDNKKSAAFDT